ncbi:MAG: gliding motility-associated ABC transporter substrate-binding protein GldG [Chitinophagales bacterium]
MKNNKNLNIILVLAIVLIVNFLGSFYYKRFDLTEEKRYSLSEPTKEFLNNLDDIVSVQVYLTGSGLPSGLKELEHSTDDILNEFKAYAGSNFDYDFIDIKDYEDEARLEVESYLKSQGLNPIELNTVGDDESQKSKIFPGVLMSYKGRTISSILLESQVGKNQFEVINNSIALLEYKLANSIQKLQRRKQPFVAFSQGNGELDQLQLGSVLDALQQNFFKVEGIDLETDYRINPAIDILVLAKPTEVFTEKDKFKIDQFVMQGGKVLWAIDGMNADMDSLQGQEFFMANEKELNLTDILFKYGIRVNDDLIQDLQNTPISLITGNVNGQPQMKNFPWLFNPILFGSKQHAIVKNIEPVKSSFTSTLDTIKNKGIKKTPLLTTSPYSKALLNPVRVFLGLIKDQPNLENFKQANLPAAYLLEGKFTSVFKGRLTEKYLETVNSEKDLKYIETSPETKMIIISDGDILSNDVEKGKPLPLGFDRNTGSNFGNKNFIINCLEYLVDDNNILETRNKEIKLRQLDAVKVKEEKVFWQQINLILPSLLLIIFGVIYFYIRKKRFA